MRRLLTLLGALLLLAAQLATDPATAAAAGRPSAPSGGHGRGSGERKPRVNRRSEGQLKPPPPTSLHSAAPRLSTQQLSALQGIVHTLSRTSARLAQQGPATLAAAKPPPPTQAAPPPAPKPSPTPKLGESIRESLEEVASAGAQREAARKAGETRLAEEQRLAREAEAARQQVEQERLAREAAAARQAQAAEEARRAQEAEAARRQAEQERLAREAEAARQRAEADQRAREEQEKIEARLSARGKAGAAGTQAAGQAAELGAQAQAEADTPGPPPEDPAAPPDAEPAPRKLPAAPPVEASRSVAGDRALPPAEAAPGDAVPAPRDAGLDFLAQPRERPADPPQEDPPAEAGAAPLAASGEAAAGEPETPAAVAAPAVDTPVAPSSLPRGRFAVAGPLAKPDLGEHAAALLPPAAELPPAEQAAAMLDPAPATPSTAALGGPSLYFTLTPAKPRGLVLAPMLGPGGAPPVQAPTALALPGRPVMPEASLPKGMDSIQRAKTKRKLVALTLDDGPHPEYTSRILSTLARYEVRATFDLVGVQCLKNPQWAKMIAQAGHELASHTYDHFRLPKLPLDEKAYQIDENQRLIGQLTGVTPRFLRPPGGQSDPEVEKLCRERGMVVALWDVGLNDLAAGRSAKDLAATALADTKPGSILLAHDGSQALIDALPAIIEGLRAKGFEFVTLSELASSR